MKKVQFLFVLLFGALFFQLSGVTAGKSFEGVITYKITYPGSKFTENQLAMFPKITVVTIKGDKAKTELQMSGINTVEITDYTTKSKVSLINMMGQKYAVKQTTEEIEKESANGPKPTIELTSETKMIAGYTCKKAIITTNDKGEKNEFEVYYTSELGSKVVNFDNPLYKDIDGVLLEFTMKTPQVTMKFTATGIEKKSVSSKEFDIPPDYVLTTQEELKSKFGGME